MSHLRRFIVVLVVVLLMALSAVPAAADPTGDNARPGAPWGDREPNSITWE